MSDNSSTEKAPVGTGKKPYEKPSFRYEKVFVTSALTCGKSSQEANCTGLIKVS